MGIPFYTAQLGEVWFACICDQSGVESFNCVFNLPGLLQKFQVPSICNIYCTFQKHKNNENQKPPSQLHFSPQSILITVTSNEPSTNHQSQTMTFWTCWSKFLFPERSSKMIDGSEKRKRQLVFELWNSRVFEKHRNRQCIVAMENPWFPALSNNLDSRKPRAQKPVLTSCQGQEHFPFGQGIVR